MNDLQKAAEEFSRILKSQGHFKIITANPAAYLFWTAPYENTKILGKRFEGQVKLKNESVINEILYLHTLDDISKSLETMNLRIQDVETFRSSEKSNVLAHFVSISGKKI